MAPTASPNSPSRRRGPRKGDRREQAILETAEQLLSRKSLHEISVDEMARGAEISRPTFYFYFESKFAVLRTLVERVLEQTYADAELRLTSSDDLDEAVRASIQASAQHWREHGAVLRAAVQTLELVPEMERFWENVTRGFMQTAAKQIERERAAGLAAETSPGAESLATALIWMNERCFYTASLGVEPSLSESELVDTLTAIWLRAIYGSEVPAARASGD